MRKSILSLTVVAVFSLACGTGVVKDRACTVVCSEAKDKCAKKCPDGAGNKACVSSCKKAETKCVKACN